MASEHSPRFAVRLERRTPSPVDEMRRSYRPDRLRGFRVFVMNTFLFHLMLYMIIMVMLFFLNILTWSGVAWFMFPAVGWGSFLAMHGGFAWLVANIGLGDRAVTQAQQPIRVSRPTLPSRRKVTAPEPAHDMRSLMALGLARIDDMRAIGRRMRTHTARAEAQRTLHAMETTLVGLNDQTDELPLARDVVHGLIEPAHRIFVEYDRLVQRQVASANAVLNEVETHDLPKLRERAESLHERVHRGTLIDLEVAREMLHLGEEQWSALDAADDSATTTNG